MTTPKRYKLVFAIYLTKRDFSFVLFEGAQNPIDWATTGRGRRRTDGVRLGIISKLLDRYQPDVVVLQDTSWTGTRRSQRIANLNAAIFELSEQCSIPVCVFSRDQVRAAFGYLALPTKHAIAESIAKHLPVFEAHLPPRRKRWEDEHNRMGLFDAAALALTFFQSIDGQEQQAA